MDSNLREIFDNVFYLEFFLSSPNAKENKRIGLEENSILEKRKCFL